MNFKALDFFGNRKIQMVTIENPYDTYQHSQEVRELMSKVWKMKLDGYKSHYPYGILPIGEADWYSNHTLGCEIINGQLEPFFGYKQITSAHCKSMKKDFPIVPHMFWNQKEECSDYINAINSFIEKKENEGELVGYNSAWTMSSKTEEDEELKEIARNLSVSMYVLYYTNYGIKNVLTSASAKYKVDRYQKLMGFEYLTSDNEKLPPYPSKAFYDEPFYIMFLQNGGFPKELLSECQKHQGLWDQRIVINAESLQSERLKAG